MCGVLLALSASAALAQNGGLDLTWKDCVLETSQQDINFTNCTSAPTTIRLYSVLKTPVPLPSLVTVTSVYDLWQESDQALAPYWRFDASCNRDGLTISTNADPAGLGVCAGEINPWGFEGGQATSGIVSVNPRGRCNRVITMTVRTAATSFPLETDRNYFINTLTFHTVNRGPCPGCDRPVSIVWSDAELSESNGNRIHIAGPDKLGSCVRLNHAFGPLCWGSHDPPRDLCAVTPVLRSTWGALKSIYR
jgi:hypothetical protein